MKNLLFAEKVSKFSFYKIYLLLEEQVSSNLQVSQFFLQNVIKNLLYEEPFSSDLQVSQFSFTDYQEENCYWKNNLLHNLCIDVLL